MAPWEPLPVETDEDAVTDRILDGLATRLPGWVPVEGAPEVALAEEIGRETAATNDRARVGFELAVAGIGETVHGLPVLLGAQATMSTRLTVSGAGAVVPAGFTVVGVSDDGVEVAFELPAEVTSTGVTVDVTMRARDVGELANGVPVGPLTVVTSTSTVVSADALAASTGGVDPESLTAYLSRLVDYVATLRPGGVRGSDLAVLARNVTGVHRALGVDNHDPGLNEIQSVAVTDATSGTFTLTFEGQTTGAVAYNATAATVQAALEALSNIAPGDVMVTGGPLGTAVTVEFTGALKSSNRTQMTATSSLVGKTAAVTIDPNATADNEVTYTAVTAGAGGNAIRVAYTDPAAASAALAVSVAGNDITVALATDAAGAITSTALQVRDAVNAHAGASGLVTASLPGTTTGAGVVAAVALTNLAGGADPVITIATTREGVAPTSTNEKMATVFPVDTTGLPVSASTRATVDAELQAVREVNFIIHVADPTYTPVQVTFTAVAETGADPTAVQANVHAALKNHLDPARWGASDGDPASWAPTNTVRYLDLARVAGSAEGVAYLSALTLNGGTSDVTLPGAAALPAPLTGNSPSTITGTAS